MHDFLPFIVIGLTTGSVYGLAGVGLVLTYKTSGIFNFAHGSVATLSVFVFYFLRTQHHWPWPAAAVVSVLVLGPALGMLLELMARVLATAGDVLNIAATIGLVIIVLAVGDLWYGSVTNSFPSYLPTTTIRVLGVNVGWDQMPSSSSPWSPRRPCITSSGSSASAQPCEGWWTIPHSSP